MLRDVHRFDSRSETAHRTQPKARCRWKLLIVSAVWLTCLAASRAVESQDLPGDSVPQTVDAATDASSGTPVGNCLPHSFIFADLFETPPQLFLEGVRESSPDISDPGPDMGDFPNSAYTLPRGRAYIESGPFSIRSANSQNRPLYAWPFLLRYGVTDDVEFRLFSSGLISEFGDDSTSGFAPLVFDLKVHLWDGRKEWFIPAASLEVALQTEWGSRAFSGGTLPLLSMNFDLPLFEKTNLEWTIGYGAVEEEVRVVTGATHIRNQLVPIVVTEEFIFDQFSVQWAVEQDLTDRLQVFVHGYYFESVPLVQGPALGVGAGAFYQFTKRLMGFGSCNAGLTEAVSPLSAQIGFAYAL